MIRATLHGVAVGTAGGIILGGVGAVILYILATKRPDIFDPFAR